MAPGAVVVPQVTTGGGGDPTQVPPTEIGATGKMTVLPILSLAHVRSEHSQLGMHVSMEGKEKIWRGAYVDMFDLLCNISEGDGCREGQELLTCK